MAVRSRDNLAECATWISFGSKSSLTLMIRSRLVRWFRADDRGKLIEKAVSWRPAYTGTSYAVARHSPSVLDINIGWLPTAEGASDANMRRFRVRSPHLEREQAVEEGAMAYQCLPQIFGGGLLAV